MASVRQKGGKWYYRITITCGENSHKYIERGSFKTKKEALEAGKRAELAYKDGDIIERRKSMTFDFLAEEWINNSNSKYKQTTINGYKKELKNIILPVFTNYDISVLDAKQCQKVIDNSISKGYTRNRLSKIKACMSRIFKYAVRNGYLKNDPSKNVYLPEIRSKASQHIKPLRVTTALPKEEIDAIFRRFPEGHPDFIPLLLGYRCGLRLGEAFGLLMNDVDLRNRCIYVKRQIQYDEEHNKLYFSDPKYCNQNEYRTVYLDNDTWRILSRHINKIEQCRNVMHHQIYYVTKERYLTTEPSNNPIFLLNVRPEDGTYISPRTMQHVSRVIHGKTSSFEYIDTNWDFHALRHTHASECIAAGMSPVSVQKRLGHKNLETTYRYYIHETDTQMEESKNVLETMYTTTS